MNLLLSPSLHITALLFLPPFLFFSFFWHSPSLHITALLFLLPSVFPPVLGGPSLLSEVQPNSWQFPPWWVNGKFNFFQHKFQIVAFSPPSLLVPFWVAERITFPLSNQSLFHMFFTKHPLIFISDTTNCIFSNSTLQVKFIWKRDSKKKLLDPSIFVGSCGIQNYK